MKHLFILFFLLTTNAFAQGPFGDYAVVKDKDGYVNIRAKGVNIEYLPIREWSVVEGSIVGEDEITNFANR